MPMGVKRGGSSSSSAAASAPAMPVGVKRGASSSSSAAAGGGGGQAQEDDESQPSHSGLSDILGGMSLTEPLKTRAKDLLFELETKAESQEEGMVVPHDVYPKVIQVLTEVKNA